MAESRLRAHTVDARLLGVDLPRMKIEHGGLAVDGIDAPERPAGDSIGQESEMSAPARGPVGAEQADGRRRHFEEARSDFVREPRRIRYSIVVVANWIEARAVAIPRPGDAIEGPGIGGPDREARRPIALDHSPRHVLDYGLRQADVREELALLLFGRALMSETMARDFVTCVTDATNQCRVAFRHPAQREERRPDVGIGEHGEDSIDILLDPARLAVPLAARDVLGERRDLEVILDVDRQRVHDRRGRVARAVHTATASGLPTAEASH